MAGLALFLASLVNDKFESGYVDDEPVVTTFDKSSTMIKEFGVENRFSENMELYLQRIGIRGPSDNLRIGVVYEDSTGSIIDLNEQTTVPLQGSNTVTIMPGGLC